MNNKADIIAMNFEASAAVGAVVCSQGGVPINGGHIQYWMGQAREARAERDAAARGMQERMLLKLEELYIEDPGTHPMQFRHALMNVPLLGANAPKDANQWPVGCKHPPSCKRHSECMYLACTHHGRPIAADASSPKDGRP